MPPTAAAVLDRVLRLPRVALSNPSLLAVASVAANATSWIQIAVCGDYVSGKYGKFSITPTHLAEMRQNFTPGRVPCDYDHLSEAPSLPHQAIAAGWLQKMDLRDNGRSLWALAEWTPKAAAAIRAKEYLYISPSFVTAYTTATGQEVGAKLLAAALTNSPFLPGMSAITLGNHAVFGQFAAPSARQAVRSLSEAGAMVCFHEDTSRTPELTPKERALSPLVVKESVGQGDDEFLRLTTVDGDDLGWYSARQISAAPAPDRAEHPPAPLTEEIPTAQETAMKSTAADDATTKLSDLASSLATTRKIDLAVATKLAGQMHPDWVAARREVDPDATEEAETPSPVLSLTATERKAASFVELVTVLQTERGLGPKEALSLAADVRPDLAAQYAQGA